MIRGTGTFRRVYIMIAVVCSMTSVVVHSFDLHFEGPGSVDYLDRCEKERENDRNYEANERVKEGSTDKRDLERANQWDRDNLV